MPYTSLTTSTQAGELKLEASQHSDLPGLTNTTNTELRISLSAKGQWCLYNGTIPDYAVFNAQTDWKGMVQLAPNIYANHQWRKAGAPAGCVLAEILDANGFIKDILAAPATLDLPPGHKVVFVINDDVNWYADNSGQISLSYSCSPKDANASQSDENLLPVIYANNNFTGAWQALDVGRHWVGPTKVGNDQISSVKVPPGFKVTLFQHGFNEGRSKVLYADAASLPDFDNITSSVIIEALPIFYENANYGGVLQPLDRGQYPDCGKLSVGNDRISSVKVPLGYKVTLYRDSNFQGPAKVLYSDAPTLSDFDNNASSIIIEALAPNDVNALQGNGFYTTDGNGNISLLKQQYGWPKDWGLVIPGDFGSNSFTDLLFYSPATGVGEFYTTDGKGNISLLKRHTGWNKSYSVIIPGNFGGSSCTDLFFYNPSTGDAEFFTTDGNGTINPIKKHSGWRKTWNLIIPGNFGGNEYTDLLLYDPTTGDAEIYTTDGNGNISLLKTHTGWRRTWSLIIPGNFGGSEYTDLLLYDATRGDAEMYTTDGNGNISLLKTHTGWLKTWSVIIPGDFGGNNFTDLLLYDPTSGEAAIFTTDGNGNTTLLKRHTGWRKTWKQMIPGNFSGGTYTSFLFYDPLAD